MEVQAQNLTSTGRMPLDRPTEQRPHRLYFALTNSCNRACPWCCTYSSPAKKTFLSLESFESFFPEQGLFEVQLEGGEPTIHPQFEQMVSACVSETRCQRLILVTNGVNLSRNPAELASWLSQFNCHFTLKLSINHYLLDRDKKLLTLAAHLKEIFRENDKWDLVLNVRLRKGFNEDQSIVDHVKEADLLDCANVFFLQRYGAASEEKDWEEPFIVGKNFTLINPDGSSHGQDLIKRSHEMGRLI